MGQNYGREKAVKKGIAVIDIGPEFTLCFLIKPFSGRPMTLYTGMRPQELCAAAYLLKREKLSFTFAAL